MSYEEKVFQVFLKRLNTERVHDATLKGFISQVDEAATIVDLFEARMKELEAAEHELPEALL